MKKINKTYEEEGMRYQFDADKLKLLFNKKKFQGQKSGNKVTKSIIMEDLADELCVSVDAIKNWMYGYNAPSEIEQVKSLGEFFHVEYHYLLNKEEEEMTTKNTMNEVQAQITKDCVRDIYRKMLDFMETAESEAYRYELIFDEDISSEEERASIRSSVYDTRRTLSEKMGSILYAIRYAMLDIPKDLADSLEEYIFDKFANMVDAFKPSPFHDVDYESEENREDLNKDMSSFSQELDNVEWYCEEGYRNDFLRLFSDYTI